MLHALVTTDEWRQSLTLLDTIKLTAKPSTSAYCVLVARAFAERDTELGWRMLTECVEADKQPRCEVFVAYIRMCRELFADDQYDRRIEALGTMFKFIGQHCLVVTRTVVEEIQRALERGGSGSGEQVTIGNK